MTPLTLTALLCALATHAMAGSFKYETTSTSATVFNDPNTGASFGARWLESYPGFGSHTSEVWYAGEYGYPPPPVVETDFGSIEFTYQAPTGGQLPANASIGIPIIQYDVFPGVYSYPLSQAATGNIIAHFDWTLPGVMSITFDPLDLNAIHYYVRPITTGYIDLPTEPGQRILILPAILEVSFNTPEPGTASLALPLLALLAWRRKRTEVP
ncbi:MAG: hypothetical protein U0R19_41825 [Bryobacteraceae bacterium]